VPGPCGSWHPAPPPTPHDTRQTETTVPGTGQDEPTEASQSAARRKNLRSGVRRRITARSHPRAARARELAEIGDAEMLG